jgi:hypothetical protein
MLAMKRIDALGSCHKLRATHKPFAWRADVDHAACAEQPQALGIAPAGLSRTVQNLQLFANLNAIVSRITRRDSYEVIK